MSKFAKPRSKSLSGKTAKQTPEKKELKTLQLVFSFLTAPVK
jgi:hypothetical protein